LASGGFVKKLHSLSFLATLAVVIGLISWGSVLNARTPSTTPDTASPQQTPQTQPTPSPQEPTSSQQAPNAQRPPSQTPDTTAPESGSKPDSSSAPTDTQTFSGTIVKQSNKYMLKDDSGKMYDIDHQSDVAKFEGKRVRVQGTLDADGKILVK
jgi:cytoskeletal protein RodZ